MSDETVEVPVSQLRAWATCFSDAGYIGNAGDIWQMLPKPKPRIVAVNLDEMFPGMNLREWVDSQPALLDVLDGVIDEWTYEGVVGSQMMKVRIRKALGVSDEA